MTEGYLWSSSRYTTIACVDIICRFYGSKTRSDYYRRLGTSLVGEDCWEVPKILDEVIYLFNSYCCGVEFLSHFSKYICDSKKMKYGGYRYHRR